MEITIQRLLQEKAKSFELTLVAGQQGLDRLIVEPELHRPGLAFAGFLEIFTFARIQVLGNTETSYLASLSAEERRARIAQIFRYSMPCFIVTGGNPPPLEMIEMANLRGVPLMSSPLPTTRFNAMMNFWLESEFAERTTAHGVFVDVFGEGVLITGGSGIGKSECGLELIERGHRLVADDVVLLKRLGRNILMGSTTSALHQHHMEVRGLGIIDVEMLFGIGAVREEKRVSLVVELMRWTPDMDVDRLGMDEDKAHYLDVPVRKFRIPVDSGRNTSILVEVAALQHRLLERGHNPAEILNQRLMAEMRKGTKS